MNTWTRWRALPDPRKGGYLHAPIGPGLYELRNRKTGRLVLIGISRNVAHRMTSLLPAELGGTSSRNNEAKRRYVGRNLKAVEYRTQATRTREEAALIEREYLATRPYRFPT